MSPRNHCHSQRDILNAKTERVAANEKRLARLNLAAKYAGCAPRTLRRRISEGTITGYRLGSGRLVFIDLNEIDAMLTPIPTVGSGAA